MRARFAVLVLILCGACAGPSPRDGRDAAVPALRLSDLVNDGDAPRRASMRLLLDGLDEDSRGRPEVAVARYERALQVDPTNPYAYLALARHHVEGSEPARALVFLDQAEALLGAGSERIPGLEAHRAGLRGAALDAAGRPEAAAPLLDRARATAPGVWSDGRLDAREFR